MAKKRKMPEKVFVKAINVWGDEAEEGEEDDPNTSWRAYQDPNDLAEIGQKVIVPVYKLSGYVILDNKTEVLEDQ